VLSDPVTLSDETVDSQLSTSTTVLLDAVRAVSSELDFVRHEVGPDVSARLAGAEDELVAIHDEMRQQHQEIGELLAGARSGREAMMRRFLATLPLAAVLTSHTGKILEANAAAHAVLQVPTGGLAGKPLFAYVAQEDRRQLRSALTQAGGGDELVRATATVAPRHGVGVQSYFALVREAGEQAGVESEEPDERTGPTDVPAEPQEDRLTRGPEPAGTPLVRWVIVPDYEAVDGPPSHQQLEALTRLCRLGAADGDLRTTLGHVARLCQQAVVEADHVSLQVGNPLEPTMAITSSATAQHLDGLQHARTGGPAFEAFRTRRPVARNGDAVIGQHGLTEDEISRSLHSVLAVPLITDDLPSGVFTVYSAAKRSLATLEALRQVMPFVEAAQMLIRDTQAHEEMRRTQEQLTAALTSRAVIDQAKGMIMISLKCNADEAFGHLVRMSSTRHEKVRDVAQSMVDDVVKKQRPRPVANPSE
jgi:PAS domain-containing protein